MGIYSKFVKTPGGQTRFVVTTEPPSIYESFRSPVPQPPKFPKIPNLIKGAGRFLTVPALVLTDFFFNNEPLSDGTVPDWIKDPGEKQEIGEGVPNSVGIPGKQYKIKFRYDPGGEYGIREGIHGLPSDLYAPFSSIVFSFTDNNQGTYREGFPKLYGQGTQYSAGGHFLVNIVGMNRSGQGQISRQVSLPADTVRNLRGFIEFLALIPVDDSPPLPSTKDTTENTWDAGRALIDTLSAEEWQFSGFSKLPGFGNNKYPQIDFIPLPTMSNKLGIVPTPTPVPIPEPEPKPEIKPEINGGTKEIIEQKQGQKNEYPDLIPGKKYIKRITTKDSDGKIIKITVNPSEILNPTPAPVPDPKPVKITKTPDPEPKNNIIIFTPTPVPPPSIKQEKITDNDPKPLPPPIIPPVKPPNQTKVDDCAGKCGGLTPGQANKLNSLNNLVLPAELVDLALLKVINTKLGGQIANGGISSGLRNMTKSLAVDRWLNLLNTALLFHNAFMLGSSVVDVVVQIFDNVLNTIGFRFKDVDGEEISFGSVVSNSVKTVVTNIIGKQTYSALTSAFIKGNRILNSASNLLSNMRSIIDSTQDIAETTGENVSAIGNALKKAGAVRENAYSFMPEQFDNPSRILNRLEKIQDAASTLEDITSEAQDISEDIKELQDNKKEFDDALKDAKDYRNKGEEELKKQATSAPDPTEKDEERGIDDKK